MELKPCPICGKRPKIKRDYNHEGPSFGAWCIIQCKPFLRKPHLKVEEGKAQWEKALKYAIEEWNRRIKMKIVKANDVPIYEITCEECESVIRYKACEVTLCHITCPVCGVSLWANTIRPVAYEPKEEEM